ncbi:unnamed protein product [Phytomonas sp. Hart1]|nr:unnamed protein product [Phytomonas sp. Hart1]|eukprot:CCW71339.1 unnamed protein product [Phytomonas sp. isolate Hart1]
MKRRVLRAHANKRQLRLIFTTNHLSNINSFQVLCDASFLRAVIHSYWSSQNGGDVSNFRFEGVLGSMAFMRDAVVNAFNVIDHKHLPSSQPQKEVNKKSVRTEGRKKISDQSSSGITVNFYYLPETELALRRMMSNSNNRDNVKATINTLENVKGSLSVSSRPKKHEKQQGHLFKPRSNSKTPPNPNKAINDLFLGMTKLTPVHRGIENDGDTSRPIPASFKGRPNASKHVSGEVKAIEAFAWQQGSPGCNSGSLGRHSSGPSPNHFFFIASQSHDVRRVLSAQAGLLRWAQHPDCVWIELKSASYSYPDPPVGSVTQGDVVGRAGAPAKLGGADTHRLSAADVAFMKHLGVLQSGAGREQRPPQTILGAHRNPTDAGSTIDKSEVVCKEDLRAGASSLSCDNGHTPTVGNRKRKRQHNPNPLSMKKKQKRESFRIG